MPESRPHILAIDVGNSRIKCGLLESPRCALSGRLPHCLHAAVARIDEGVPWSRLDAWTDAAALSSLTAVIAGSNPAAMQRIIASWPSDGPPAPVVVEDSARFPLAIDLPEPGKVGIDRLLNAVAANRLRAEGSSAVIVDCGTATTVDFVSAAGAFAGGAILPGFELSARALHQYTARLPLIDLAALGDPPPDAIGRDTAAAIRSGLFWGQLGGVKELIAGMPQKGVAPLVLLTGGGGSTLQPHLPQAVYEPHLSLQGLALVAEALNQQTDRPEGNHG